MVVRSNAECAELPPEFCLDPACRADADCMCGDVCAKGHGCAAMRDKGEVSLRNVVHRQSAPHWCWKEQLSPTCAFTCRRQHAAVAPARRDVPSCQQVPDK